MDKMIDLIEKCFAVGWTIFFGGFFVFVTVGMCTSALDDRWLLFFSLVVLFLFFLGAFLFGLQKCISLFSIRKSTLKLKKAAHFISISAFLYMGIFYSVISITSPKENVGKLAIFGWVAFVFTAVSYWHDYRQFKGKR
ncbi:hypothetical protein HRE39_10400 [Enterococcus faecalis]|nr:hypothetical protein [Enterococcus faecalis]